MDKNKINEIDRFILQERIWSKVHIKTSPTELEKKLFGLKEKEEEIKGLKILKRGGWWNYYTPKDSEEEKETKKLREEEIQKCRNLIELLKNP